MDLKEASHSLYPGSIIRYRIKGEGLVFQIPSGLPQGVIEIWGTAIEGLNKELGKRGIGSYTAVCFGVGSEMVEKGILRVLIEGQFDAWEVIDYAKPYLNIPQLTLDNVAEVMLQIDPRRGLGPCEWDSKPF